jgi:hypothetical protein
MAMQRIRCDDAAIERQQLQHLQGAGGLVAAASFLLSNCHSRLDSPDIDHVQRRSALAAREGAAQRFAIDGHHAAELNLMRLRKGRHETPERSLESLRLEQAEHAAEGVVTGNPMLQAEKQSQQVFLGLPELGHVRAGIRPTQHRRQRNNQYLHQIVPRIVGPRVRQPSKNLLEFAHPTPSAIKESFSESILPNKAIGSSNPYAIPLPRSGRG